jgi:hypothetical protein
MLGFMIPRDEDDDFYADIDANYERLTQAWRELILQRRAQ